jgi:hypothetical protein
MLGMLYCPVEGTGPKAKKHSPGLNGAKIRVVWNVLLPRGSSAWTFREHERWKKFRGSPVAQRACPEGAEEFSPGF